MNIAVIGYNFSYFKGTYRQNLFHAELAFLVMIVACFVGAAVNAIGNAVTPVGLEIERTKTSFTSIAAESANL